MNYTVYWNNVCLLSKVEKQHIKSLESLNLPFEYRFFGLGQERALSAQLDLEINAGENNADIVVSTDVDVFHNPKRSLYFDHYNHFIEHKKDLGKGAEVKWNNGVEHPEGKYKPFLVIPLVFMTKKECGVKSFKDLLDSDGEMTYAFGGLNNSAGQSLLKSIWWLYGLEAAQRFLKNAKVGSMPAKAYQMFSSGQVDVAIVPTIFALRAGIGDFVSRVPEEGAVAIPSYIAVKDHVPDSVYDDFEKHVLSADFQKVLSDAGAVHMSQSKEMPLLIPPWSFLESIDYHSVFTNPLTSQG